MKSKKPNKNIINIWDKQVDLLIDDIHYKLNIVEQMKKQIKAGNGLTQKQQILLSIEQLKRKVGIWWNNYINVANKLDGESTTIWGKLKQNINEATEDLIQQCKDIKEISPKERNEDLIFLRSCYEYKVEAERFALYASRGILHHE